MDLGQKAKMRSGKLAEPAAWSPGRHRGQPRSGLAGSEAGLTSGHGDAGEPGCESGSRIRPAGTMVTAPFIPTGRAEPASRDLSPGWLLLPPISALARWSTAQSFAPMAASGEGRGCKPQGVSAAGAVISCHQRLREYSVVFPNAGPSIGAILRDKEELSKIPALALWKRGGVNPAHPLSCPSLISGGGTSAFRNTTDAGPSRVDTAAALEAAPGRGAELERGAARCWVRLCGCLQGCSSRGASSSPDAGARGCGTAWQWSMGGLRHAAGAGSCSGKAETSGPGSGRARVKPCPCQPIHPWGQALSSGAQ